MYLPNVYLCTCITMYIHNALQCIYPMCVRCTPRVNVFKMKTHRFLRCRFMDELKEFTKNYRRDYLSHSNFNGEISSKYSNDKNNNAIKAKEKVVSICFQENKLIVYGVGIFLLVVLFLVLLKTIGETITILLFAVLGYFAYKKFKK